MGRLWEATEKGENSKRNVRLIAFSDLPPQEDRQCREKIEEKLTTND
jgi:hypothetical protein